MYENRMGDILPAHKYIRHPDSEFLARIRIQKMDGRFSIFIAICSQHTIHENSLSSVFHPIREIKTKSAGVGIGVWVGSSVSVGSRVKVFVAVEIGT